MARRRRLLPPIVMVAGLFLFGASLLELGTQATQEDPLPLHASGLTANSGAVALLYRVDYYGHYEERIEVEYAFPQHAGDAYFVNCQDADALQQDGTRPTRPLLAFEGLSEGSFVVSRQTLPPFHPTFSSDGRTRCDPSIAFVWDATDGAAGNRPSVEALYYPAGLGGDEFFFLSTLMATSALLTLLGGLAWVRGADVPVGPPVDGGTLETLRASLDQVVTQLERTRKNLLFAGILGVFLWYPFLVPWAWQQGARATGDPAVPWTVATLTLAFLVVLTILWAREFIRLDRQLNAWRGRLGELRHRESRLMESLEQGG